MKPEEKPAQRRAAVHLVVAHAAEARPLIDRFQLQRRTDCEPFRVFSAGRLHLILSGAGKVAAAAAVGHLDRLTGGMPNQAWLNVGIGGHAELALGAVRLAERVTDASSARCWHLPAVPGAPCPEAEVVTVEAVTSDYAGAAIHDMEAAGFCAASTRFSTLDSIHVLKVVSDNRQHPYLEVTPQRGRELIANALDVIEWFVERALKSVPQHQRRPRPSNRSEGAVE